MKKAEEIAKEVIGCVEVRITEVFIDGSRPAVSKHIDFEEAEEIVKQAQQEAYSRGRADGQEEVFTVVHNAINGVYEAIEDENVKHGLGAALGCVRETRRNLGDASKDADNINKEGELVASSNEEAPDDVMKEIEEIE